MGKYKMGGRSNIIQSKKYTHIFAMHSKKDFATNIWIPTLSCAPNKMK